MPIRFSISFETVKKMADKRFTTRYTPNIGEYMLTYWGDLDQPTKIKLVRCWFGDDHHRSRVFGKKSE